jgi:quercetin dioxygenase-like cupin family protein
MEIKRSGSQPSNKGPADWFTGSVRIDPLFQAPDPARVACASVTFEPGARTAWHTHPLGQTLIVTSGLGWAQRWGGPIGRLSRLLHAADDMHKPRQPPASQETPASVGACHFH